jgi:hypothetical protein
MRILNESKRDDLLLPYLTILNERGVKCSLGELKRFLLRHFVERGGFRNLSLGSNFYLAGVARYYFNGDLTLNQDLSIFAENPLAVEDNWKEDVCKRLNALILILRNAVIDSVGETFEQPEDFGELSIDKLLKKYKRKIDAELGIVSTKKKQLEPELDRNDNVGNGYTFEILYSYQDARKYYEATHPGSWCITYGEGHYNGYVKRLNIHYVIFRQNGWENIPRQCGPNFTKRKPQDEYGCSLIALLQSNSNGEPIYITSRWNHGNYSDNTDGTEADHAFTKEEFFAKTGVTDDDLQRIFQIWRKDKPTKEKAPKTADKEQKLRTLRFLKYAQMCINGGESPDTALIKVPVHITEPQLKQEYFENHRKVIAGNGKASKSIIQYKITVNGDEEYYVLCDQGRILYETVISSDDYYGAGYYASYKYYAQDETDGLRNIIIVRLSDNKYMIYNIRFHKFLEIDGVKVFKYIDKLGEYYSMRTSKTLFYEIKMSNRQVALIDINTNIPLKLPNGNHWCEAVECDYQSSSWGREIRPRMIKDENDNLCLTYDSSANEVYVYNIKTKKFTQISTRDIPRTQNVPDGVVKIPHLESIFGEGAFCVTAGPSWNSVKVVFNQAGQRMKIGDFGYFREISIYGDYYSLQCYRTAIEALQMRNWCFYLYSVERKSFVLDKDGEPLIFMETFHPASFDDADIMFLMQPTSPNVHYYDDAKYTYYAFLMSKGVLLRNPIDNSEIFVLGYSGKYAYRSECYRGASNLQYNIPFIVDGETHRTDARKLVEWEYYRVPFVDNSAAPEVIEMNPANGEGETNDTLNEVFSVTCDEIKMMVNEVINRLI